MELIPEEVLQYVAEEDVKFLRLAFVDVFGRQRNVAIMASELQRAFEQGIAFDASAVEGFDAEVRSDLFLRPDPSTLQELPWRPQHGRVAHLFCQIYRPDGTPFEADTRRVLREAMEKARQKGLTFSFGSEMEFYLFQLGERGERLVIPFDQAGYMDVAPEDKGENVRREICLTLERMGIYPESSHHESGPGQNEIDFRYADPIRAADHAVMFRSVVKTIAAQNGLWADFSPRPLPECAGSGMHINVSAQMDGQQVQPELLIPGLMAHVREATLFFNPCEASYARLGRDKAPGYVSYSPENRSQLIRIPAASGAYQRVELRSPDAMTNPYLAFAIIIYACLDGIERGLPLPPPSDFNSFHADAKALSSLEKLPRSLQEARDLARQSAFLAEILPDAVLTAYIEK